MNLYRTWWEEFVKQSMMMIPYTKEYWPEFWELADEAKTEGKEKQESTQNPPHLDS